MDSKYINAYEIQPWSRIQLIRLIESPSHVACHTTDGPPTIGPHGPSAATMDGPPGPCTAATLGLGGPSTALSITTLGPPPPDHSLTGVAASVAKYT